MPTSSARPRTLLLVSAIFVSCAGSNDSGKESGPPIDATGGAGGTSRGGAGGRAKTDARGGGGGGDEIDAASALDTASTADAEAADSQAGNADAPSTLGTARPCKGMPQSPAAGGGPAVLRSDVSVRRLLNVPGTGSRLARDAKTGEFLLLLENGTIRRIEIPAAGAATSTVAYTAADIGLARGSQTYGMSLGPDGTLYVVSHLGESASATTSKATIWKGVPGGGGARSWSRLAETAAYPRSKTYYDHEWSGITVDPAGKYVYVNAGSRTDHGEVQTNGGAFPNTREVALTAAIFRLPTSGNNMMLPNDESALRTMGVLFAKGTRNSFDLEFAPNGELLAGDNGPDADYHEELNWIREGQHYGFPWRLGNEDNQMQFASYNPANDKRLQQEFTAVNNGSWKNDPGYPKLPAGVTFADPILNTGPDADQFRNPMSGAVEKASTTKKPYATFSDHSSPLGLTFDRSEGALCGEFSGGTFILRFGKAAGRAFEAGRDLLHVKLASDGRAAAMTQLARGFSGPVDAVIAGDKLYILDRTLEGSAQGSIWEVTLPNGK